MCEIGSNYGRLAPDQHITIKDKPVSARVHAEQAEQIEALADESNMTMSTYLRLILQKAIDEKWVYQPQADAENANENSRSHGPKRMIR
ncbi:hypothetical protein SQW19_05545 [Stenotrophomonas acidaminiphila]|uniref:plasmid mobilization protein n=1 Tax=Stenotrophomonas acidaminiphila TaxID=128780 RepID=UPI002ABE66A8|nr:hypothetical protein [Stenotrophomonas acidaminiphila]WPU57054.1 hypothetical protein SQW19_05545 [Stenotrophomonas acidaminiphila]